MREGAIQCNGFSRRTAGKAGADAYKDARPAAIAMPFDGQKVCGKKNVDSANKADENL